MFFIFVVKGGLLKFFSIEQILTSLQEGTSTRYQIYQNFMMAKQRGYTARADLFREALKIYDRQQEGAKK
ncbi:TPA: hypothetical protein R4Z70_004903 [Klebsiella variicola subsp. variicola]|uniref:hypothetical protein n=1 Tax=Klebsiella TaxID=570 RepID=UPI00224679AF|nr:hypothetical protein [Klebsiella grimontii]MCW9471929.1 hypothetical protein [Klebsiella grimontii]HED2917835.1 hypothetical protein [Klebsiella variicola subsp. variicola]HED3550181.1 hypothetical protein [Klebsiella variicola subsp. variicola]